MRKTLELSVKTKNTEGEISSRLLVARAHRARGSYREVLIILNPLLPRLSQTKSIEAVAEILNSIGIAHYQLGHDTIPLIRFIGEVKSGGDNLGELKEISQSLKAIGRFYLKIGNYQKAIEFFSKSVRIDSLLNAPSLLVESFHLLGTTHLRMGRPCNSHSLSKAFAPAANHLPIACRGKR